MAHSGIRSGFVILKYDTEQPSTSDAHIVAERITDVREPRDCADGRMIDVPVHTSSAEFSVIERYLQSLAFKFGQYFKHCDKEERVCCVEMNAAMVVTQS